MCVSLIRVDSQMLVTGYKRKSLNIEMGIPHFYEKLRLNQGNNLSGSEIARLAKILDTTPDYLCCNDISSNKKLNKVCGETLKERRKKLGYNQKVLSQLIGCTSQSRLCVIESSTNNISTDLIDAICYYLKCDKKFIAGESSTIDKASIPSIPTSILEKQKKTMQVVISSKLKRYVESSGLKPREIAKTAGIPLEYLKRGMVVDTLYPHIVITSLAKQFKTDPCNICPLFYTNYVEKKNTLKKEKQLPSMSLSNKDDTENSVEVIETVSCEVEDRMISVNGLAKVTDIATKNPELLNLMIQINELEDSKIQKAIDMIDVIVKGLVVSD